IAALVMENDASQYLKRLAESLFVASLITLGSCSNEFHKGDLVGTYVLNTGTAIDSLELKSNGDYVHGYQGKGSSKEILTGKWELQKTPDGQLVSLDHFRPLPMETSHDSGYYFLQPDRLFYFGFGSICLV